MKCKNNVLGSFKKTYCYLFLSNFLDIGNSAGSLFIQAITLFRTFQRFTAPKEFKMKFSKECQKLFKWASDLVEIIMQSFRTNPLTDFELFNVYSLVFPLAILTFISATYLGFNYLIYIFLLAAFFGLGVGVAYVKINKIVAPAIMSPMGGFIFLYLLIYLICFSPFACCCKKKNKVGNEEDEDGEREFSLLYFNRLTYTILITGLIFYVLLIPIMSQRWKLTIIISIIMGIIPVPLYFIEIFIKSMITVKFTFQEKLNSFLISAITLVIIPATESFANIIQLKYKNNSFVIATYVGVPVIIPLALILTMIIVKHPNIRKKYKESKYDIFYYFELFDILKQVGYAVASKFDYLWVCLLFEVAWLVVILVFRPYDEISQHSLTAGNSIVLIISNSLFVHSKKHQQNYLSFGLSVFFMVLACLPALLSLYFFFIFDFIKDGIIEKDEKEIIEEEKNTKKCVKSICIIASILSPIGWFCYGLMLPTIANIKE